MNARTQCLLALACCALLKASVFAAGDDDDDKPGDAAQQTAQPALNEEQRRAAGIRVAHPVAAQAPERMAAVGVVLDPTALVSDLGDAATAAAGQRSASAELTRLQALYRGGAGASLKMIEAAQAEQAKAQAQAQLAQARLVLHWGALNSLPQGGRDKLIAAAISGRELLLRADLPGRHTLGAPPSAVSLDVDGIRVPGRVLGPLRESTESQGVGLLIEVPNAPFGLGPGARVPVELSTAARSGLLLPRDALLYDENGAYVYKQLNTKTDAGKTRYAPVKVNLLVRYGDGWLVKGVDDDDDIVVHGAGVLWSLQGVGSEQRDDDDDG